jgi:hypothetical protein
MSCNEGTGAEHEQNVETRPSLEDFNRKEEGELTLPSTPLHPFHAVQPQSPHVGHVIQAIQFLCSDAGKRKQFY